MNPWNALLNPVLPAAESRPGKVHRMEDDATSQQRRTFRTPDTKREPVARANAREKFAGIGFEFEYARGMDRIVDASGLKLQVQVFLPKVLPKRLGRIAPVEGVPCKSEPRSAKAAAAVVVTPNAKEGMHVRLVPVVAVEFSE